MSETQDEIKRLVTLLSRAREWVQATSDRLYPATKHGADTIAMLEDIDRALAPYTRIPHNERTCPAEACRGIYAHTSNVPDIERCKASVLYGDEQCHLTRLSRESLCAHHREVRAHSKA
jgi:hypothetical protein